MTSLQRFTGYAICSLLLFGLAAQIAAVLVALGYVALYLGYGVIGTISHWYALWHCGEFCPR